MIINTYNISITSFLVKDSNNHTINTIKTSSNNETTIKIECGIYLSDYTREILLSNEIATEYNVFLSATFKNYYIEMQKIILTPEQIKENSFFQLYFSIKVPNKLKTFDDEILLIKNCDLSLSITHKHTGEMGIGESMHQGQFFKTTIPMHNEVK